MHKLDEAANMSDKRKLNEFLVGNSKLEELSAKLDEFDIFQVLRIEQTEIRHSNVLSWLLNPQESHGLERKRKKWGQKLFCPRRCFIS